jgi:TolB protein
MNTTVRAVSLVALVFGAAGMACSTGSGAGHVRTSEPRDAVLAGRPIDPARAAWGSATPHPAPQSGVTTALYGNAPNTIVSAASTSGAPDATENVRQVTFATEGSDFDPSVSPDASRVFFASTRHRETADIYVQSVTGSAVTQLTSHPAQDVMPAASPDGATIAFASNREGSWDIFSMPAGGGSPTRITSDPTAELHPTWSSDGTRVAYCKLGERSGRWEIWITDTSRPAAHSFLAYGLFPKWHPTEDRILFQRSRERGDRFFSIWTIDLENGEGVRPTEVASTSEVAFINPTWSPDGSRIACAAIVEATEEEFAANPNARALPPVRSDIWVFRADGSGRVNLTGGWFVNTMPTWGTDGRIYFVSDRGGAETIWSIAPDGAATAPMTAQTPTTPAATPPVVEAQATDPGTP